MPPPSSCALGTLTPGDLRHGAEITPSASDEPAPPRLSGKEGGSTSCCTARVRRLTEICRSRRDPGCHLVEALEGLEHQIARTVREALVDIVEPQNAQSGSRSLTREDPSVLDRLAIPGKSCLVGSFKHQLDR